MAWALCHGRDASQDAGFRMAHVLLVDDESVFLPEQVRQALPEHAVTVATSGSAGLASIRAAPPEVVLLDLGHPDRSGLDVFEENRALDARLPVIYETMAKRADAAIEAGKQMRAPVALQQTTLDPIEDGALFGTCPAML